MSVERPAVSPQNSLSDLVSHGLVSVVAAAQQSGLLDAIDSTPRSAASIAARCASNPRATALVLDALASVGVCVRANDGYSRAARAAGDFPWSFVREFLATGRAVLPTDDVARRGELYARAVGHLAARFERSARALAAQLPAAAAVLDVGCGSGVWSLAMAERHAGTHVVGLDFAQVLPVFHARAAALGVSGRAIGVAGNYLSDGPELTGRRFDRVVFANVLHLESEAVAAEVVARWASSVAGDGELVIVDCLPNGSSEEETLRAFYALHLGMRTERGAVHSERALREWCTAAGFAEMHVARVDETPGLAALVARRSGPSATDQRSQ